MECLLPYLCMVTVPHIMVGLERMLDYRVVGLERFHCACNLLSQLFDIRMMLPQELPEEEYTALSVLTYIGCGVSLICLVLCIVFFMCQKLVVWVHVVCLFVCLFICDILSICLCLC